MVGAVVVGALEGLGLQYPQPTPERREKYAELAKQMESRAVSSMAIRVIRYADYVETPWKNGGGVTHEIARSDKDGDAEWRISLATIDRDGPFSDFTGYDRTIVPLDGGGFELSFDDGSAVVLDRPGVPFRFAGEKKVFCRLLDGRSRDLNAMALRARWQHDVAALALSHAPGNARCAARIVRVFRRCGVGCVRERNVRPERRGYVGVRRGGSPRTARRFRRKRLR